MKKILSLFLLFQMVFFLCSTPVYAASFNVSSVELLVGDTKKISYSDDSASISSSNTNVVKISTSKSNGYRIITLKAVGAGTAKITASSGGSVSVKVVLKAKGITISGPNKVNEGKKIQLKAEVFPKGVSQNVGWSSSNSSVAKISAYGQVTGVKSGSCKITAHTTDGSNISASYSINVTIPVSSVKLNKKSLTLNKGQTFVLVASVSPSNTSNKAVSWNSSNSKIATVSSTGLVTGKKAGKCKITCISKANNSKKAVCSVVIEAPTTIQHTVKTKTTKKQNPTIKKTSKPKKNTTKKAKVSKENTKKSTTKKVTTSKSKISQKATKKDDTTVSKTSSTTSTTNNQSTITNRNVENRGIIDDFEVQIQKGEPVHLQWKNLKNIDCYEIYMKEKSGTNYYLIYNGPSNQYYFGGYKYKTDYIIKIRAYIIDENDNVSYYPFSEEREITTPSRTFLQWLNDVL